MRMICGIKLYAKNSGTFFPWWIKDMASEGGHHQHQKKIQKKVTWKLSACKHNRDCYGHQQTLQHVQKHHLTSGLHLNKRNLRRDFQSLSCASHRANYIFKPSLTKCKVNCCFNVKTRTIIVATTFVNRYKQHIWFDTAHNKQSSQNVSVASSS